MKANMIIFLSLMISFWNTYNSLNQPTSNPENSQLIHEIHYEMTQKHFKPSCNVQRTIASDSMITVKNKESIALSKN